ncbi:MAG: ABC transporter permease [Chloroflexota bacterium]|nr:ABC transporter permease [Chloroflexota bacterium]
MTVDYIVKRLGMLLVVIISAISINFIIPRLMPGDPVQQKMDQMVAMGGTVGDVQGMVQEYRKKFGLDKPVWKQFISYWGDLLRGDLGYSLNNYPQRVSSVITGALPWTAGLLITAILITFVLGILMGAVLGWPTAPRGLRGVVPVFLVLHAVPYFLLGIILLFLFAVSVRVFPGGGGYSFGTALQLSLGSIADVLKHAALPALSIVLAGVGGWALGMRGMMISVLGEDYINLAEAKGLKQRRIFLWYGVRNTMLPATTSLAMSLGHVVTGAVLVEMIFAYPGIGHQLYRAIHAKDYTVIQGIIVVLVVWLAVTLFIMDLIYPLIDRRITYRRR